MDFSAQDPYSRMISIARTIREILWEKGFVEVFVPVIRAHDCSPFTPRIKLQDGGYLQDSPALALRRQLKQFDKVFSLSPCFRDEEPDATHLRQFHMLDLYQRDATLREIIELFKILITKFYGGPIEEMSIADKIHEDLNVDLKNNSTADEQLVQTLSKVYNTYTSNGVDLLDRWIREEVEPLSINKCLILTDFPWFAEARAKPKTSATCIAERAEFLINETETVHIYEDDPDVEGFVIRSKKSKQFGEEDEIMKGLVNSGDVPRKSAGGAIGIERLCASSIGLADMSDLVPFADFIDS
ncbi:amino acid--tRNA ligase-related protein [Marinobacter adhaerens]|jgi:lysyl-tRNA synthetase class 2|uniref:amino acid--tRNA ligase-related protein n=1 Tax=Marinobacter adhaerens TaxID=1033846 RepID=UPI003BAD8AAF